MSNCILTYTKTRFYPLRPIAEDIRIEDIAHSLSLMTRANGHFKHFYSVAQHAINCYKEAKSRGCSERIQLSKIYEDCIGALCLAVTGMLGTKNGFRTIPEKPMCDSRGILMQMVYAEKMEK